MPSTWQPFTPLFVGIAGMVVVELGMATVVWGFVGTGAEIVVGWVSSVVCLCSN